MKILIINTPGLSNRGSMAVIVGALNCLKESVSDAEVTILCHHWQTDKNDYSHLLKDSKTKVVQHPWFRTHKSRLATYFDSGGRAGLCFFSCSVSRVLKRVGIQTKNVFLQNDVIIDLNTDALTEAYGSFPPVFAFYNMLLSQIAGKPLVVWATCVVPFKNKLIEKLGRLVLSRAKLITVREAPSACYLGSLGVCKSKVTVTADFAFLLHPSPQKTRNQLSFNGDISLLPRPLIGITPAFNKSVFNCERYVALMGGIIDSLVHDFGATVVLVPHSFGVPPVWSKSGPLQGSALVQKICDRVDYRSRVYSVLGAPSAGELKAIIGSCDVFISSMLHPLIAATSLGVPSIALVSYNPFKFHGILSMMGQEDFVIDASYLSDDELKKHVIAKLEYIFANREIIHESLNERSLVVQQNAKKNGQLLKTLIASTDLK